MSVTRTWIDAAVLVVASTAVITNGLAFCLNVTRLDESPIYVLLATLQAVLAVSMFFLARRAARRILEQKRAGRMNVRIVRGDVELPCRLCYAGVDDDGIHTWIVVAPPVWPGDRLHVGVMPPRTAIVWEYV